MSRAANTSSVTSNDALGHTVNSLQRLHVFPTPLRRTEDGRPTKGVVSRRFYPEPPLTPPTPTTAVRLLLSCHGCGCSSDSERSVEDCWKSLLIWHISHITRQCDSFTAATIQQRTGIHSLQIAGLAAYTGKIAVKTLCHLTHSNLACSLIVLECFVKYL